jgi:cystathionine beta-lyase/cystathionine gamma-synthase
MKGFSTISVHGGEFVDPNTGTFLSPIYQTTVFALDDEKYRAIEKGRMRDILIYTRYDNPTIRAVEKKICLLEKGEDALLFSSGMAAMAATIFALLEKGDHVISTLDLYGGTVSLLKELTNIGIDLSFVDPSNINEIETKINPKTKLLLFETLSNPLLKVLDIEKMIAIAKKRNIYLILDNTFLTYILFRPLSYGADLVIHSASKYLNGHNDIIAGVVVGKGELIEKIWNKRLQLGGSPDPHQSYLLLRGLKTLELRMLRHSENATAVANFLENHPKIKKVIYPGLTSHPQHGLAQKYLKVFGGVLSFVIEGGNKAGVQFMHRLKMIKEAATLGGVESLVMMPFNTSHVYLSAEERERIGIVEGLVRLSCGIENVEDIISDLDQSLQKL